MELFALLGTILTIVAGAINNAQNRQNANEQLANQQSFSHNEAELANQRAIENYWTTMSPEAKVKQYKDAGLSVGLMYGGAGTGGGVTTGSQAQTPGANLPIMQNPMVGSMTEIFENLKKMAETENIGEDTEKKKQEIEEIKSQIEVNNSTIEKIATENNLTSILTENAKLDGIYKSIENEIAQNTKEDRIKIVAEQLNNIKNEGKKLLEEIEGLKIDNKYKEDMYNATLNKMAAETVLLWEQVVKTEAETKLVQAQTALTNENTKLSYVERQKAWKEIEMYQSTIAKIDAEAKLIKGQTGLIKYEKVSNMMEWMGTLSHIASETTRTIKSIIPGYNY